MTRDDEFKRILEGRLTEKRFIHSLNVADSARELAEIYGGDEALSYTAGLIHDCCKDMAPGLQLSYMLGNGLDLSTIEINAHKLYHAICGSLFIQKEFGIENQDVINAVKYHTTGRKDMSLLEKIVFVADFISAERDYPDVDIMRKKAKTSLDEAIAYGLGFTIKELVDKGVPIHPNTVDAYNDAILNLSKKQENLDNES
ncbi:MAG: bis(5'-nucleosyl)-tetraphosphatase (symmetrical) YqeK [Oscillospiraceae bacterium]|nr:bis(5'-nucleosyl)-tetraphosphatase (symmetrical) YqeK [Oscillospiraceae bacterium]